MNRVSALPGPDAFPELATPTPEEDGDDFLDALLGMDTLGVGETVEWPEKEPEPGVFAGGVTSGVGGGDGGVGGGASAGATGSKKRAQGGGAGKGEAWGAASRAPFVAEDGGDSVLDDLLGLELGIPPTSAAAAAEDALISPDQSDDFLFSAPAGTTATTGETPTAAGIFGEDSAASPNETAGDGRREGGGGERAVAAAAAAVPAPFDGAELGRLCTHLNDRNRRAKRLAQRCQEMFLRLFFKVQQRVWSCFDF